MSSPGPVNAPVTAEPSPPCRPLCPPEEFKLARKRPLDPVDSFSEDSQSAAAEPDLDAKTKLLGPRSVPIVKHYWTKEEVRSEMAD